MAAVLPVNPTALRGIVNGNHPCWLETQEIQGLLEATHARETFHYQGVAGAASF